MKHLTIIIMFLMTLSSQALAGETRSYTCYHKNLEGELNEYMSFDLMPAKKFGNVLYAYEKTRGETSSLATYSENQNVIVWSEALEEDAKTFIFDAKTSQLYIPVFMISKARKGGGNPSIWMELNCNKK
tara:strand:- start:169 stop:555 length:387 start_codon:yes stop_codon:yes gene_type:complete